jgi:hypothetical protein
MHPCSLSGFGLRSDNLSAIPVFFSICIVKKLHGVYVNSDGFNFTRRKEIKFYSKLTWLFTTIYLVSAGAAYAAGSKPNVLVIMSDDVGITNISAYSHGMMG